MTDQTPARPLPPVTCPREGAVSPVPWPALPSTPRAGSGALTLQLHPPSPALFSFEAGGKGGRQQERGVEVSQRPQNVLSSSSLLPTLAWPTGPQKALPVSLATPVQHSIPQGQRGQEHHRQTG